MASIVAEKSFQFSIKIIEIYKQLQSKNEFVISKQLLRSDTSIGANIEEAIANTSQKEFAYRMSIALKEARETKYWLKLLNESNLVNIELDINLYICDVEELIKILGAIVNKTYKKQ